MGEEESVVGGSMERQPVKERRGGEAHEEWISMEKEVTRMYGRSTT